MTTALFRMQGDDTECEEERQAFLSQPGRSVMAELHSKPCGDSRQTAEQDLATDFYKHVAVGAEVEFGEVKVGEDAVAKLTEHDDDPMHRKVHRISAIVFHYTKYYFSFFLFLILGPILAFCWAIVISLAKFIVSWVFYPVVKLFTVLCRPTRSLVRIMLWPAEPAFEIMSRCCPVINFSLWSSSGQGATNQDGAPRTNHIVSQNELLYKDRNVLDPSEVTDDADSNR